MVFVFGAGVTGLTVAFKASESGIPCTVVERSPHVGGMASSFQTDFEGESYTVDYGPHKIYTQIPRALAFFKRVLGEDLLEKPKKSKIRLQGKYFDYPIKIGQVLSGLGLLQTTEMGLSFVSSKFSGEDETTYKGYLTKRFGKKIYETIFRDLAGKVWGDPVKLDFELARTRLAAQSLPEMVSKLVLSGAGIGGGREISAKVFYYPKHGFNEFNERLAGFVGDNGGRIVLESQPRKLFHKEGRVVAVELEKKTGLTGASKVSFENQPVDFIFSTIPLPDLVSLFNPHPPEEISTAASKLKYRSLILLFMIVDKKRLFDDSFIFFPEKQFVFNRLSEQKAFSEYCVPEGKTVLCAEISCEPDSQLYASSDQAVFDYAWPSLESTGFLGKSDVASFFTKRAKRVYPVYDVGFKRNLDRVVGWLDGFENVLTLGRQGLFNYNNTDHCVDMGLSAFESVSFKSMERNIGVWKAERKRFENYVIVD